VTRRLRNRNDANRTAAPRTEREQATYLHCKMCLDELPPGASPALWARLSVGVIRGGVQIWCERHDAEVVLIDFAQLESWKDGYAGECEECRRLGLNHRNN